MEKKPEGINEAPDEIKMAVQGKIDILEQGLVNLSISNNQSGLVKISVETPQGEERLPCDLVCILDISGSMATEAHVKNTNGVKEKHGLSYLDLLKHATKTIIKSMNETDRFGLVTYSDDARVEFPLSFMSQENQELATIATENLEDEGCTNIWSGVEMGLEMLRNNVKNSHQAIMLLTDGEPNIYPPSGLVNTLLKYKKQNPNFLFSMNSYAFGKRIDTPLLTEYAQIGDGSFNFIPCPGFIGTIFVNSLANILSTMGSQCQLEITMKNGAKIAEVFGAIKHTKNMKKATIDIGDLKYQQSRDIVLAIKIPDDKLAQSDFQYMDINLKYFDHSQSQMVFGKVENQTFQKWEDPLLYYHYCRCKLADLLQDITSLGLKGKFQEAQKQIEQMAQKVKQNMDIIENIIYDLDEENENQKFQYKRAEYALEQIKNLKKDIDGELTLAVAKDYSFNHWGKHFIPSIGFAHYRQQCNNFCDPGIQNYGGAFFQNIKDQVEKLFLSLPAPKPSKKKSDNDVANQVKNKIQQLNLQQQADQQLKAEQFENHIQPQENEVDMNDYYNCGGGCFEGNGAVLMSNGHTKKIRDLKKGDLVQNSQGQIGKIECLVKIQIDQNSKQQFPLIELINSELKITAKHPIFESKSNKWIKPYKLSHKIVKGCKVVYNIVLDQNYNNKSEIVINEVSCVSLGHQIMQKEAYHPYFGSKKIIKDLQSINNYQSGYIEINQKIFQRNEKKCNQVEGINIQQACQY